jgi:hypothetical protein
VLVPGVVREVMAGLLLLCEMGEIGQQGGMRGEAGEGGVEEKASDGGEGDGSSRGASR